MEISDEDSMRDLADRCARLGEPVLEGRWESHAWADLLHGGLLARGLDEARDCRQVVEIQARIAAPEAGRSLKEFLRCYPHSLADQRPHVSSYYATEILSIIGALDSGAAHSKDTDEVLIERFQRHSFQLMDQLQARLSLGGARLPRPDPGELDLW